MNERLKQIRESLHLTQAEFAKETGKGRATIANYELGRVIPDESYLLLIYEKYGYNPEWIRTGQGDKKVQSPYWEKGADIAAKAMRNNLDEVTDFLSHFFDGWEPEEKLLAYELLCRKYPKQNEKREG